jgi:tetratricopeptide (TPR) repeat protein
MLAWLIVISAFAGIIAIYWYRFKDTQKMERVKVKLEQIEGEDAPRSRVVPKNTNTWKKKAYDYRAINDAYNKADLYYAKGDLDEAQKAFVYVLSLDPDHEESNNKLGLIYVKKGNLNKAESIFKRLTEDYPKNPVYFSNLALTYFNLEMFAEAKKMYEQAINLDPKKISRYINLGQVCVDMGDLSSAVGAYSKALVLNTRDTELYFIITDLLVQLKAYEEAIAVMVSLQDLQPYNTEAKEKERELKILKGTNPLNNKRGRHL